LYRVKNLPIFILHPRPRSAAIDPTRSKYISVGKREEEEMEAQIVHKEAFTVIGLKYRGQNETGEDIPRLWEELAESLEGIENPLNPKAACGVVSNYDDETATFDYVAGVEVEGTHHVPLGMTKLKIPDKTYAVFRCSIEDLDETYREIYETWLPHSSYQRADGPEFEQYSAGFLKGEEDAEVSVHIPIKEA
jgi:AraC family transcriptional regulator